MNEDIAIYRGDSIPFNITVKTTAGVAVDITGYTFYFTVKSAYDSDATDVLAVVAVSWNTHSDPTGGITTYTLSEDVTYAISPAKYYYDIRMKVSSTIITIASGRFDVFDIAGNRVNT